MADGIPHRSGTNENLFPFDGTNFTCPCNGVARAEPGIDFIQEVQIQSAGASAEFGDAQGAVINVITRQGGERFLYDASYYWQTAGLTSQPGTDAARPRAYEQDRIFAKLTWRLAPGLRLMQSFHEEFWVNPERPTLVMPYETTRRTQASVPAITFGHLTHTVSANTVWDVRAGRFRYAQETPPSTGDRTTQSRFDQATSLSSGAPREFGALTIMRTTAKATISHYQSGWLGADHQWKTGVQVERGEHRGMSVVPTGVRFVDDNGGPFQRISRDPSHDGGMFVSTAAFVSDAITLGDRFTISAGLRFDHSRASSQDLPARDLEGRRRCSGRVTDDSARGS